MNSADSNPSHSDEHCWEEGWEGHERAQKQRMAALPFAEKLLWLEEAHEIVLALRASGKTVPNSQSNATPGDR